MQLLDDWKTIISKAWSVKFNIAAALLGGVEVAAQFIEPTGVPAGLFAAIAAVVSMLAVGARVMAQQEITNVPAK
jgi:hypothetical protein